MTAIFRRDWQKLQEWSPPVIALRELLLKIADVDIRSRALACLDLWGSALLNQQLTAAAQDLRWSSARRDFCYAAMAVQARSREQGEEFDLRFYEELSKREPSPPSWEAPPFVRVLRTLSYPLESNAAIRTSIESAVRDLQRHCQAEQRIAQRIAALEQAFTALEAEFNSTYPGESLRPTIEA